MTNDSLYGWNVYIVGAEGFRESFHVSADTTVDLALRRKSTLDFLKESGALSDVRKIDWSEPRKISTETSPKLASVAAKDNKAEDPMLAAAVALGAVKDTTDLLKPSKLAKYAKKEI